MVTIIITHIKGLITPLITTHEPPSKPVGFRLSALGTRGQELRAWGFEDLER